MKKRRLAASFTPEAIRNRLDDRRQEQAELNSALASLQAIDITSVYKRNLVVDEQQALLLLSCKVTFEGVILLKMALDHIPCSFSVIPRGTNVSLRVSLVHNILAKNGIDLSVSDVELCAEILERCCPVFSSRKISLDDSLWKLTEEGTYNYNRFIGPPVQSCLACEGALVMKNSPSKAVVYESMEPKPATKVTLVCNSCKTTYGLSSYHDERGQHLYQKAIESHLVEASNVTYMERSLYKWIPCLGLVYIYHITSIPSLVVEHTHFTLISQCLSYIQCIAPFFNIGSFKLIWKVVLLQSINNVVKCA